MNHLIECPHPLKTTDLRTRRHRLITPHPGDVVDFSLLLGQYPANKRYGTICNVSEDRVSFCCEPGSVFINESGVDISGGPFGSCARNSLIAAHELIGLPLHFPIMRNQYFWNWGNNGSGAGNGVHYNITRPVFIVTSILGYRSQYSPAYSVASGFTPEEWQNIESGLRHHFKTA
jgi:hypothetical protein